MATLGGQLKAAREAKGATLSEAAAATHIKVQHLEGLEAEDFSRIASPVYVKGFIRIYARHVGLDPEPLIREYAERFLPREPVPVIGDEPGPAPWWKKWVGGEAPETPPAPHRAPPSAMTPRKQISPHAAVVHGEEIPSLPPPEVPAPAFLPPRKGEEPKRPEPPAPAPKPSVSAAPAPVTPPPPRPVPPAPAPAPVAPPAPDGDLFSKVWTAVATPPAPEAPVAPPAPPVAAPVTPPAAPSAPEPFRMEAPPSPAPAPVRPAPAEASIFPKPARRTPAVPEDTEAGAEREISPDLAVRAVRWMAIVAGLVVCLMLVRCVAGLRSKPEPPQIPQVPSFRVPGLVDEAAEPYLPGEPELPRPRP